MTKEVPSPLAGLHAAAQAEAERLHGAHAPVTLWRPGASGRGRRRGVALVLGAAVALAAAALSWHKPAPASAVAEPAAPSAALHPAGLWTMVEGEAPAAARGASEAGQAGSRD